MARSRQDRGEVTAGGASSLLTSARDRALGRICPLFGRSIIAKGLR
ncbi:hypothetical protein HNQ81_000833 [Desulfoprunum benzoelyticum]|uniref:Uncharacterized protein n=1 Tax=Desulfoprunum benzoelyticum TaxID=1506996 RepID=A0A840UR47_9BACT|nr:hypothetical protein [Desulfoprunum benzoelyticum]